ncbi:YaiO family outer membrane beta-barrel protein [bacterium]|nr:YaiO family outer membrane beta-barrel protein [bacterium]
MPGDLLKRKAWKPCIDLICFVALLLCLCSVASAEKIRLDSAVIFEDFSFADTGHTEWVQAVVPSSPGFSLLGRVTLVRRFQESDFQGTVGGSLRVGAKTGLEGEMSVSPGAVVLPRFSTSWSLYRALASIEIMPHYRFSRFQTADVHLFAVGAAWPVIGSFQGIGRAYISATSFHNGPTEWNPAFLLQGRVALNSRFTLIPSYSFYRESFEAGAPDETRRFSAHIGRIETWHRTSSAFLIRIAWEYEGRTTGLSVGRYDFGIQYQW